MSEEEIEHPDEQPKEDREPPILVHDLPELAEDGDKADEPVPEESKGA